VGTSPIVGPPCDTWPATRLISADDAVVAVGRGARIGTHQQSFAIGKDLCPPRAVLRKAFFGSMIDIVLPCLDEAAALPLVLADLPEGTHAIVVDNGSTDGSPDIARSLGAQVVSAPQRGYGAACHAGLVAATADVVAFVDCDGSFDLSVLPSLAAPVIAGSADLAVGRRRPVASGVWPVHARVANGVLSWRLRRMGLPVHDVGAVRVGRRTGLLDLAQIDRRSGYPLETMVLAAKAGWRVVETDVDYHPREGRSKVTGTVRGTIQAMRDMTVVLAR